jgi:hypothetical protein
MRRFKTSTIAVRWNHFTAVSGGTSGLVPNPQLRVGSEKGAPKQRLGRVFLRRGGYRPPERG